MATNKEFLGRIILKHDTAENWALATNFIPKKGEVIIYDIDDNYNYERFKIGDGKTVAKDLPFQVSQEAVSSAINALDVTDIAIANKYVSAVNQTDGKISVTRTNLPVVGANKGLTIDENRLVGHASTIDPGSAVGSSGKISIKPENSDSLKLPTVTYDEYGHVVVAGQTTITLQPSGYYSANPTASGKENAFISSITQADNGKITATRALVELDIAADASDDDIVILTGTADKNGVSYDAKHKTYNSTYTSGNTTTAISGSGGTIKIPQFSVDAYGHITAATDEDVTIILPTNHMVFKGTLGANGTVTTLPTASTSTIGHTYKVITAGTYANVSATIGDLFTCNDQATWVHIPSGDDEYKGTVTSIGAGAELTGGTISTSGTIAHAKKLNATYTSNNEVTEVTTGVSVIKIPQFTANEYGHITTVTDEQVEITIPDYSDRSVIGHKHTVTHKPAGSVTSTFTGTEDTGHTHTFTGDSLQSSGSYTPDGTVSSHKHTFTGTETEIEISGDTSSTTPTFTGSSTTFTGSFTPAGTVANHNHSIAALSVTSKGDYTPEGEIANTVTDNKHSHSFSGSATYTPAGSVTVTPTDPGHTHSITSGTGTVYSITAVGTLPSFTNGTLANLTIAENTKNSLVFTWTAPTADTFSKGTLPTKGDAQTVVTSVSANTGSAKTGITTAGSFSGTQATISHSGTTGSSATGITVASSFTGTEAEITVQGATAATNTGNKQPGFTGTAGTVSVSGTPKGSVSAHAHTFNKTITYTPEGTTENTQPGFSGTAATIKVSGTPTGSLSTVKLTPAGTISSTFTGTQVTITTSGSTN